MPRILLALLTLLTLSLEDFAQPAQEIISSLPFRNIGPAYMTGRIADIEKVPSDPSTWYVAVASGNVWKTTNRGSTWEPIFETYGSFSMGCIAVDPKNPQVLWLGTGENQSQRSVSWGDGVYKSLDGGKSWENMGLTSSEHIGKIIIHPENSDIVYVAAQGPLWKDGGDRGLYKTLDGGKSWEKVLNISEYTGISDLCMDAQNPDILYAASYQRRRHVGILVAGGEESRIYKSADGGASWEKLKRGLPGGELGRIALAVSPQKPSVVYALIAGSQSSQSGFYRSEDYGESWVKKNDYIVVDPQYYGEIFADPHQFDHVYAVDVIIRHTKDGGESFERLNTRYKHVDNHDIVFDPSDPDYLMVGCDGGIYESWDRGDHWTYHSNLPIMQFYRVGLDNAKPFYNVYGGTQDNSTLFAPSRTTSRQGITNSDWKLALGGDGFQARIDPTDPNIAYCQSQYAGIVRYDKRTGQRLDIQPQPAIDDEPLRWHWDSPLLISHYNPQRLYFAAQRIFRSDNRGDSWEPISGDLSRGEDRNQRKVMGKIYSPEAVWKNVFTSPYGTIVALSESPLDSGILVAGTDDGLIQITTDGGKNWNAIHEVAGVPPKAYVADVFCSQHDREVIYAVFNNHKEGDFSPYIARSGDLGNSWQLLTQGISAPHACWSIIEDYREPNLLFAATEYGIFCSVNRGANWTQMKGKLPTIAFRDLEIQQRENDLVGASFGRGMFILDDYSLLRNLSKGEPSEAILFPVKDAQEYFVRGDWGYSSKGVFGDNFYTAPNPPYGACFNLYLPEKLLSKKEQRKALEKKESLKSYPDPATIQEEDLSASPSLFIQVLDSQGKGISTVAVKNRKGYQQVVWDLSTDIMVEGSSKSRRIRSVPQGRYTAQILQQTEGILTPLGAPQSFQVTSLVQSHERAPLDNFEFFSEAARQLLQAELLEEKLEKALTKGEEEKPGLLRQANSDALASLEKKRKGLLELQYSLLGNQSKKKRFEYFLPGIKDRLRRVYSSQWESDQITDTHRENLRVAMEELGKLEKEFVEIVGE